MSEDESLESSKCPSCGWPAEAGHAPSCPDHPGPEIPEKYIDRPKPLTQHRFELSRDPELKQRLRDLRVGFESYRAKAPETLAFTLYGSMVKGTAVRESDIDGYLFVDAHKVLAERPSAQMQTRAYRTEAGREYTATRFDKKTSYNYALSFKEEVMGKMSDPSVDPFERMFVMPMCNEVIDYHTNEFIAYIDEIAEFYESQEKYQKYISEHKTDEGVPALLEEPKQMNAADNLTSMFHLQLGHGLDQYRKYLIERLMRERYGEIVWRGVIGATEMFEQYGFGSGKPYPLTLEEAKKIYIREQ